MSTKIITLYKKLGVRNLSSLLNTRLVPGSDFEWPLDTTIHYFNMDTNAVQPTPNTFPISTVSGIVLLNNIITYIPSNDEDVPNGRHKKSPNTKLQLDLIKDHDVFKKYSNKALTKTEKLLVNYEFLKTSYIQKENISTTGTFYNIFNTIINNINGSLDLEDRTHIIPINLTDEIKTINNYGKLYNYKPVNLEKHLDGFQDFFILEILKWVNSSKVKEKILFNKLSVHHLHNVNFLIGHMDNYSLLNMGIIYKMISADNDYSLKMESFSKTSSIVEILNKVNRLNMSGDKFTISLLSYFNNINNSFNPGVLNPEGVLTHEEEEREEKVLVNTPEKELEEKMEEKLAIVEKSKAMSLSKGSTIEDLSNLVSDEVKEKYNKEVTFETGFKRHLEASAKKGDIDVSNLLRLQKAHENSKKINVSLDGVSEPMSISEIIDIKPEDRTLKNKDLVYTDKIGIVDKTMLRSSLKELDKHYIENIMPRDIIKSIASISKTGIIIKDISVDKYSNLSGDFLQYTVVPEPIDGASIPLKFIVPVFNERGEYTVNGQSYILRKQRIDFCIRKISPSRVGLSSYSGKLFVFISEYVKDSVSKGLVNQINKRIIKDEIVAIKSNRLYTKKVLPDALNQLSMEFLDIVKPDEYKLYLDWGNSESYIKENLKLDDITRETLTNSKDMFFIGHIKNIPLVIDFNDDVHEVVGKKINSLGSIYDFLEINTKKLPKEYTNITILGNNVPLVLVLGYLIGINDVLKYLDADYDTFEPKEKFNKEDYDIILNFSDVVIGFKNSSKQLKLLLNGFKSHEKTLNTIPFSELNNKAIYMAFFKAKKNSYRTPQAIDDIHDMFIDHLTESVLREMGEPTSIIPLLFRANELLENKHHLDKNDINGSRIRGYDKVAGTIYKNLTTSVKEYRNRLNTKRNRLEINNFNLLQSFNDDPSQILKDAINPVQETKNRDTVTLTGTGGLSKETVTVGDIAYHENDMGIFSEATGEKTVGINTTLNTNPNITSTLGFTSPNDENNNNLLSTIAAMHAFSINDDPKRTQFQGTQAGHTIGCNSYEPMLVRTGYEKILPQRCGPEFVNNALEDGVVTEITDKAIKVQYGKNKDIRSYPLGSLFSKSEATTYNHSLVTTMKKGEKFSKGTTLSYNNKFFKLDPLDIKKKEILYTGSMLVNVVFMDLITTDNDASEISRSLSRKLTSEVCQVMEFNIPFTSRVLKHVKVGDSLTPNSPLFYMPKEITNNSGEFDENDIEFLESISEKAPKSKVFGTVAGIEIYYNGKKKDMTNSLKNLVIESDTRLKDRHASLGKENYSGDVGPNFRFRGTPLEQDHLILKILINVNTPTKTTDKIVLGYQMKSVISNVFPDNYTTEDNVPIDVIFSYTSMGRRILNSPLYVGLLNKALIGISSKIVDVYKGN